MKYDLCAMIKDYCKINNKKITDEIMKCIKSINDANIEELSGLRVDSQIYVSRDFEHIPLETRDKKKYQLRVTDTGVNIVSSTDKHLPFTYFKDTEDFVIMRYANANDLIEIRYSRIPNGIKGRLIIYTDAISEDGKMDYNVDFLIPDYEQSFKLIQKEYDNGVICSKLNKKVEYSLESDDLHTQLILPNGVSIDNLVRSVANYYCEAYRNSISTKTMIKQ